MLTIPESLQKPQHFQVKAESETSITVEIPGFGEQTFRAFRDANDCGRPLLSVCGSLCSTLDVWGDGSEHLQIHVQSCTYGPLEGETEGRSSGYLGSILPLSPKPESADFTDGWIYRVVAGQRFICHYVTFQLIELAKKDAKLFAEEFPGETLDGSDWDASAWGISEAQLPKIARDELAELNEVAGQSVAWACYTHHLHVEVRRLAEVA